MGWRNRVCCLHAGKAVTFLLATLSAKCRVPGNTVGGAVVASLSHDDGLVDQLERHWPCGALTVSREIRLETEVVQHANIRYWSGPCLTC